VGTSRKLEEIASNLDDLSVTLEEIKETVKDDEAADPKKLDKIQRGIDRAADAIEEAVDPEPPAKS
jgi:hypothetical protein